MTDHPIRPDTAGRSALRRVALLTAAESWSGVEVHTLSLARALQAAGHSVVVIELGRDAYSRAAMEHPQIEVIRLDIGPEVSPSLEPVSFYRWLCLFKSIDCDVAVTAKGMFKFGTLSMEAAARVRFDRFLVIEHLHAPLGPRGSRRYLGGLLPGAGLWWYRGRLSGYLRSVFPHQVICVSDALARTLRQDYAYPPGKLVTAYSGVDTKRFRPDPETRSVSRREWDLPDDAIVFGTIGRLSPMKNHAQLLRAFARLQPKVPDRDMRLVIAGDGPERESLAEMVRGLEEGDKVILAGFHPRPEVIAPAFDVFCLPSLTGEALPLALLEALASATPAIGSTVGGIPEILTNTDFGWLIPPDDENSLLTAMYEAAVMAPRQLEAMGHAARAHVVHNFEAEKNWRELVDVVCHPSVGRDGAELAGSRGSR